MVLYGVYSSLKQRTSFSAGGLSLTRTFLCGESRTGDLAKRTGAVILACCDELILGHAAVALVDSVRAGIMAATT